MAKFGSPVNKQLGGTEENITPGVAAIADLMKKNEAILIKNQEQAIKAFSDQQIVMMPYWNGGLSRCRPTGCLSDVLCSGHNPIAQRFCDRKSNRVKDIATGLSIIR